MCSIDIKSKKRIISLVFVLSLVLFGLIVIYKGSKSIFKYFYPINYEDIVTEASNKYGVEKELIYAIIKCESGFDKSAHSHADAVGLMQITPGTFKWLRDKSKDDLSSYSDISDPRTNIMCGTYLISFLRNRYKNLDVALCAYNAGITTTDKWIRTNKISKDNMDYSEIPYNETKNYVKRVKRAREIYKKLYFS